MLPPPPRATRMKPTALGGRAATWIFAFVVVVVCPYFMTVSLNRIKTLIATGKTYQAELIEAHTAFSKTTSYYLTLLFTADDGKVIQTTRDVPERIYIDYEHKSKVPVITMPNNSHDYEVGGVDEETVNSTRATWLRMIAFLGIVAFGILTWIELSVGKERNLLSKGESAPGEVINVEAVKTKTTVTTVTYRFKTNSGEQTQKARLLGNEGTNYKVGNTFPVLYPKDNESKSLPLPMFQYLTLR